MNMYKKRTIKGANYLFKTRNIRVFRQKSNFHYMYVFQSCNLIHCFIFITNLMFTIITFEIPIFKLKIENKSIQEGLRNPPLYSENLPFSPEMFHRGLSSECMYMSFQYVSQNFNLRILGSNNSHCERNRFPCIHARHYRSMTAQHPLQCRQVVLYYGNLCIDKNMQVR